MRYTHTDWKPRGLGLPCNSIIRPDYNEFRKSLRDTTNGGVSSYHQNMQLVPLAAVPDVPEQYQERTLVLVKFYGKVIAVPYDCANGTSRPQRGGNWLYACDSRFPSDTPIPIFDRIEGDTILRVVQGEKNKIVSYVCHNHFTRDGYGKFMAEVAGFEPGEFEYQIIEEGSIGDWLIPERRTLVL